MTVCDKKFFRTVWDSKYSPKSEITHITCERNVAPRLPEHNFDTISRATLVKKITGNKLLNGCVSYV